MSKKADLDAPDAQAPANLSVSNGAAKAVRGDRPRVLMISDLRLYRDHVALALSHDGTTTLIGIASAATAIAQILALWPDIVLLDASAFGARHLPRGLKAYRPDLRIIACAVPCGPQESLNWVEAGVAGWVDEDATMAELVASIHRVWRDEITCPPALAGLVFRRIGDLTDEQRAVELSVRALGERERQVLALVSTGLSNKEIARKLGLQPATVKNYMVRILNKLNAKNRRELRWRLRD